MQFNRTFHAIKVNKYTCNDVNECMVFQSNKAYHGRGRSLALQEAVT